MNFDTYMQQMEIRSAVQSFLLPYAMAGKRPSEDDMRDAVATWVSDGLHPVSAASAENLLRTLVEEGERLANTK